MWSPINFKDKPDTLNRIATFKCRKLVDTYDVECEFKDITKQWAEKGEARCSPGWMMSGFRRTEDGMLTGLKDLKCCRPHYNAHVTLNSDSHDPVPGYRGATETKVKIGDFATVPENHLIIGLKRTCREAKCWVMVSKNVGRYNQTWGKDTTDDF